MKRVTELFLIDVDRQLAEKDKGPLLSPYGDNTGLKICDAIESTLRKTLIQFLDDIRDYEGMCRTMIWDDERESDEFVDIYMGFKEGHGNETDPY